jgi:glycosyltransferase involved in cell wall biosynthesis
MTTTTWLHRHDFEVAHVDLFSGPAFLWAELVCFELARLGKPFALTLRGGNLPSFATRWPRRVRRLLRGARAVTAPTNYLGDALRPQAKSISILPNAIDLSRHTFRARTVVAPRLIWLRAFHHAYNPTLAIEVLASLARRYPGISLTMIGADKGDGALAAVRETARRLRVEHQLEIVLGVPKVEVASRLERADIFLNTTDVDNSPVSVLEAMASGLCVVTTNVGGIPYLVEHGVRGLLVPPRDPGALAGAVARILSDASLAETLSRGGRSYALTCDWASVLDRWDEILAAVGEHG